jgi:hypothetical protein
MYKKKLRDSGNFWILALLGALFFWGGVKCKYVEVFKGIYLYFMKHESPKFILSLPEAGKPFLFPSSINSLVIHGICSTFTSIIG